MTSKAYRATLNDIAMRCGCSVNTASRVMRNDKSVSPATREKVLKAAKELRYVRNASARALRLGVSNIVALIVNDIHNPYYTNQIASIDRYLSHRGYNVSILCTHTNKTLADKMIRFAVSQSVDGILFSPLRSAQHIQMLKDSQIPFGLLDCWIADMNADITRIDDRQGGYMAARHLIDLGHRKMVYFSVPLVNSAQADRQAGVQQACREAGIPDDMLQIIPWKQTRGIADFQELGSLLRSLDFTAVIAFNDVIAYYCLNVLQHLGLRVPEDVSLIGFDHIRKYNSFLPPLASIATLNADISRLAVDTLLSRIAQPDLPSRENVLPVSIYDSQTTCAARP